MIDKIKACFEEGFSVNALVQAITILVGEILKYVAGEEGYDFPAAE